MPHVIIRTDNINRAAFFTSFGAELVEMVGKYPTHIFVLKVPFWLGLYEKHVGLVDYKKYANQRIRLKRRGRRQSGLPESFTGSNKGFPMGDMAMVREFTKKEKALHSHLS